MISMVFRNSTSDKRYGSKFFEKILKTAAKELKIKDNFSVSVNLVGEKKIQELNKKYRHKNKPTDVLSFPLNSIFHIPYSIPQDIGDVFVCLSIAKNDAKRENITIKEKLAQLTVHGFLHLLGYEHPDDEVSGPRLKRRGEKSKRDAEEMFKLERKILDKIKL